MRKPLNAARGLLAAGLMLAACLAGAQSPLPQPNVTLHRAAGINALARQQSDGKILVGGVHVLAGKDGSTVVPSGRLHRINADGSVDTAFRPSVGGGAVKNIAVTSSHAFIAGTFQGVGGLANERLAKVALADGAGVAAFNPAPDAEPTAMAIDAAGDVYVAGNFSSIGGVTGRKLVKLDGTTGQAVAAWNPVLPATLSTYAALAVSGSSLYVAGRVASDANNQFGRIYRVDLASGAVDGAFSPPLSAINGVNLLAVDANGNLYVGGLGGTTGGSPDQSLVTLTKLLPATGAVDPAWTATITEATQSLAVDTTAVYVGTADAKLIADLCCGPQRVVKRNITDGAVATSWSWTIGVNSGFISAIVPTPEGVILGGYFRDTGPHFTPGLAKVDTTTAAVDTGWKGGAYEPGVGQVVLPQADGKLLIGGSFDLVDLQPRGSLARLNADGSLDTGFIADANSGVWQLLLQGGRLFVSGSFNRINGQAIQGIAKLDPATGAVDAAWAPNPDGGIRRLATDGTDLYIGGNFVNVGASPRVARIGIAKLNADTGAVIEAFAPPFNSGNSSCLGTRGLAVAGGFVYSGCQYNAGSGFVRLLRVSATNGAYDASWFPLPSNGPSGGNVRAIFENGGNIYIVGDFTAVGAQTKARIAKLSASAPGTLDAAWGNASPVADSVHYAGALIGDKIYVGGGTGTTGPFRPFLFRTDAATGTVDTAWTPTFYGSRQFGVQSIVPNADASAIHIAGNFDRVAGRALRGFAAITTTGGSAMPSLDSGPSHSLAVSTSGQVFAWGSDSYGQLGSGRAVARSTPVQIPRVPAITAAALSYHVLALDADKRVWAWGDNGYGKLGPRDTNDASRPARVNGLSNIVSVAAGANFSLAADAAGNVYGWGLVPGYGTDTGLRVLAGLSGIVEVAAGRAHALARKSDGTVLAFGENALGQLGLGTAVGSQAATTVPGVAGAASIVAGQDTSAVLLDSNQIFAWGRLDGGTVTSPLSVAQPGTTARLHVGDSSTGLLYAVLSSGSVVRYAGGWVSDFAGFAPADRVASDGSVRFGIGTGTSGGPLSANGDNTVGLLGQGNTSVTPGVVPVPGFSTTRFVLLANKAAIAAKSDGSLWFWGQDSFGLAGDGTPIGSSVPASVSLPGTALRVAAGEDYSLALDTLGRMWGWGLNTRKQFGAGDAVASTPRQLFDSGDVEAIAAARRFMAAAAESAVYVIGESGLGTQQAGTIETVRGMASIVEVAAGDGSVYGLAEDGRVFAAGENGKGQLGIGTQAFTVVATPVQGITGRVTRISAAGERAGALTSDGKVWMWGRGPLGNGGGADSQTAVQVTAISDAIDLSVGSEFVLVLRRNGTLLAWGDIGLADAVGRDPTVPYPVTLPGTPAAGVASGDGNRLGFVINDKGVAWGFGRYSSVSATSAAIGDGTYVPRATPVALKKAGGAGSLDTNDWYFDLDPATSQTIPAAATPKSQAVASVSGSETSLAVDATIKYKAADVGKPVSNFVFGLVPTTFFDQVKSSPKLSTKARLAAKAAKADGFVLAQLTPSGWTDVTGQLIAYSQGTANAAGGATNILNNVDTTLLAGSRFCVGYGEDSGSMLTFQSLSEVLLLEGASANVSGVPCVLTGIYVDGAPSSTVGSVATFKASVVGLSPTGGVQFKDGAATLLAPVGLAASNDAVGTAQIATSALALGTHSIGATYSGDSQNAAVAAEIPLLHEVVQAPPGGTATTLAGPASSELASVVVFTATVAGNAPTGTVQFKDGAANLGEAVALVGGVATLRTDALAVGAHTITAAYSGDAKNQPSVSTALAHTVASAIGTSVALTSNAASVAAGQPVTFTATVTGNNPTGNVIFRNGSVVLATVALVNGTASHTVNDFDAGRYVITAEYAGDPNNPGVTSAAVLQEVGLPAPVRLGNISTRGRVETGNDVMIGGFIIGGTLPKKVLITARGPSLANFGVTGVLANPKIELYASQSGAKILENDDWQSNANAAEIAALGTAPTGLAPSNPLEAALLVTLNPGAYTAVVSGADGGSGVGIVEVFEQDKPDVPLVNISTRGQVQTAGNVMIGGFVIQGSAPQKVLITARGPSLGTFGIANPLANPKLEIFSGQNLILANDDWQTNANAADILALGTFPNGLAPSSPLEAALLVTLQPGAYTAIVSGVGGVTGVGIVEVFAK